MKSIRIIVLCILSIINITFIKAQTEYEPETLPSNKQPQLNLQDIPVDLSFVFKTSHLWRGGDSSSSPLFCTDLSITNKNKEIRFGIWNGLGTNGVFKEFNHYFSFNKSGFTFEFWDIYNFSTNATYNNREYFNYKAKETGRFWDTFVKYRLPGKLPFQFMWATIVFGRDRGPLNEYNRYSSYVQIEYPILRHQYINLDFGVGGAFALRQGRDINGKKTRENFFGETTGITDISLKATTNIKICNYNIPVNVYSMWNPQANRANIQVAVTLFSM